MKTFLLQIRELPNGIIFSKGPKMRLDGFSWAPLSILDSESRDNFFGLDEEYPSNAICTPHGLQGRWPGFSLTFPPTASTQIDLYYFLYGEFWIIIHSIDSMQESLHGSAPNAADISVWRHIHSVSRPSLLLQSLDHLQKKGLIVSIADGVADELTARPVLAVSGMLVSISEIDIFDPSQLDPNRGLEISGTPIAEDTKWTLI